MDRSKWEYKKLGEVCAVVSGSTPKTQVEEFWNGSHYWITPAELDGSTYVSKSERLITDAAIEKTNLTLLPVGTVLLSSRAPIGKVAITTVPMYCNQGFKNLICSDTIYNKYLYWFLKVNTEYLNSLGRGATFKEISKTIVENIKIPLYSLADQQRIVAELDCLNEMIALKQEQLKEFDKLAQSIFHDMFGDKDFPKYQLKDVLSKIGSGATPSGGNQSYKTEGISLIRSLNVHNNEFVYKDLAFIDEQQAKQLNNVTIEENDVLLNITGASVARCCIVPSDVLPARVNQHVSILRPRNELLDCLYLCHYLISCEEQAKLLSLSKSKAATREALPKNLLEKYMIKLPPLALQQQFAEKIQAIEAQKELVKKSIAETQQLLDSRMDYYFD